MIAAIQLSIAEQGRGVYGHQMGNNGWQVKYPVGSAPEPQVLACLDLRDPKLAGIGLGSDILPLCSRVDVMDEPLQRFGLNFVDRVVEYKEWGGELISKRKTRSVELSLFRFD